MERFLRDPSKMNISTEELVLLQNNIPTKKIWKKKLHYRKEIPSYWYNNSPNKYNIRNYHPVNYANGSGQMGIKYEEVDKVINNSDTDWMSFIMSDSKGLTKWGQKYLQMAVESYVYCVLGFQACTNTMENSRWRSKILIQTQDVFRTLLEDNIAQDDVTVTIKHMRQAISDTGVVLNMAISPGIILVPSDMIFLKKKIPGSNNILTLATGDMKFGTNIEVNAPPEEEKQEGFILEPPLVEQSPQVSAPKPQQNPHVNAPKPQQNLLRPQEGFAGYVIAGVIISLITKFTVRLF